MKTTRIALCAALAAALGGIAAAHTGATGIVLERMKAMSAMAEGVKEMTPMMRGAAPYDASAVSAFAIMVEGHAGEAMTSLFPEDADRTASKTRPETWEAFDEFSELADRLEVQARGLALAAANASGEGGGMMTSGMTGGMTDGMTGGMVGGMDAAPAKMDVEALGAMPADAVFAMIGQTCSTCHTRFRAKDG